MHTIVAHHPPWSTPLCSYDSLSVHPSPVVVDRIGPEACGPPWSNTSIIHRHPPPSSPLDSTCIHCNTPQRTAQPSSSLHDALRDREQPHSKRLRPHSLLLLCLQILLHLSHSSHSSHSPFPLSWLTEQPPPLRPSNRSSLSIFFFFFFFLVAVVIFWLHVIL